MSTRSLVYKHWERILSKWPVDLNRPHASFQQVMRRHVDKQYGPSDDNSKVYGPTKENSTTLASPLKTNNTNDEMEQIDALYSLLENRYSKKYPLSDKIMKPQSDPIHFERLVKELDEAPQRSWWTTQKLRLKQLVRLK